MPDLDVRLTLQRILCYDAGENEHAEPYLWPVYFKIDGDSVFLDRSTGNLSGKATVVAPGGAPRNLGRKNVHSGDWVPIPAAIGEYNTQLKLIPMRPPIGALDGVPSLLGCVAILLEEDNTPNNVVVSAYGAMRDALQAELDKLIPTLGLNKQDVSDDEVNGIIKRVKDAVTASVKSSSLWDLLQTAFDPDDPLGDSVELLEYRILRDNPILSWSKYWGPTADRPPPHDDGAWGLEAKIETVKNYEFVPSARPGPARLVPVTGGGGNAWTGTWYGKPAGAESTLIAVEIGPGADGTHNVQAVESIAFPALTVQAQGVAASQTFDDAYKRDEWTLSFDSAPLRRRVPSYVTPRGQIQRPRAQAGAAAQVQARLPSVDEIRLPRNVRLQLYGEELPNGQIERHRVRYIRTRADGATIQDVMLAQRLVW
jgi:hypothetical protein